MNNINLSLARYTMTWKQNVPLNEQAVIDALGAIATTNQGENVSNFIVANISNVNVNIPGDYPITLSVDLGQKGYGENKATIQIIADNNDNESNIDSDNRYQHKVNKINNDKKPILKRVVIGLIAVIMLLLIAIGVNSCNNKRAQQQAQNAQIQQNTNDINKLQDDNEKLGNQLGALRKIVNSGETPEAKQNELEALKDQNQELMNTNSQNQNLQNQLSKMNDAIDQMVNNPNNMSNELRNYLIQQNNVLNQIEQTFQQILDKIPMPNM